MRRGGEGGEGGKEARQGSTSGRKSENKYHSECKGAAKKAT